METLNYCQLMQRCIELTEQRDAFVVENVGLKTFISQSCYSYDGDGSDVCDSYIDAESSPFFPETPATDAAIAALRAEGVRPRIQERDLKALLRFNETCEDGEGYDIGIDAMNRLVEIGLCGKGYGGIRHITPFGQWVIDAQEGEIDSTPLRTESDVNADFSEHLARQLRESKGANHE